MWNLLMDSKESNPKCKTSGLEVGGENDQNKNNHEEQEPWTMDSHDNHSNKSLTRKHKESRTK